MIFSPPTQHALRALIYLANHEGQRPVRAREIAAAETIPSAFLAKILNRLRVRGMLRSVMGPGGGYVLARPAQSISVRDVVAAFDDAQDLDARCLLGIHLCSEKGVCPLHERWNRFRDDFSRSIAALDLQSIAAPIATGARQSPKSVRSRRRRKSHAA